MEATALSVGKSVLNGALGYAKSAFAEEVALQLGVQRDHAFVADELEMMQSFMMEAHEERDNNKVVKTWVKQVRDTAYDVEDSLQDFAVRLERPSWWRFPRTLLERRHVAKQMKELRAKVEDVSQRNVRYRLVKDSGSKAIAATEQSSIIAAAIFGVDDARHAAKEENQRVDLIQLINKKDEDLKVIAVWGTSGDIGIASIIRAAYENEDVQSNFPGRAWVRVMHPFCPKAFVQSLVNQFHAPEGVEGLLETEKTEQDLAHKFNDYVNKKRCLIVLNGVSTIEEWHQIRMCFRNNNTGSRIIVSTEQVEVASLCAGQKSQASELKQLSADQTLYAFYDKGSQSGKDSVEPMSSSDAATTSTNDRAVAHHEIIDQSKVAAEKKGVKKAPKRTRTLYGDLDESLLTGRDNEISDIVDLISDKDKQVISVWGMGGLGKTTLVEDLLRTLVKQLQQEPSKKEELLKNKASKNESLATMGVEKLAQEMKRLLETKSCLIVLDDLSSIAEWDDIMQKFDWMGKTTQIIVTTRKHDIANHCSGEDGIVWNLEVLKEDDARNLFSQKVFGNDKEFDKKNPELVEEVNQILKSCGELPVGKATDLITKNPELVEEANRILKKCGGLPLAIVTIGGYLASRPKTRQEWRKLNENISAELEMNPKLGMIRTVLEKSYDDHIISQRRLVRRWAAEGYSNERRGKSATEMSEDNFTELKNRSMILPSQQSVHSIKSIDSCKVHDLIREIGISKSEEENLVFRLEKGCSLRTHGAIRHLAIQSDWEGDQNEFESIVDLSRIRSLSVFGQWKQFFISDKMSFLRVLDLEDTEGLFYHHLDHIGKLLHLKYLSLRGCYGIFQLPDSLGNLRQLETLDIRDTSIMDLPKTIIKLRKLHYIHAGCKSEHVAEGDTGLLTRCRKLLETMPGACCVSCCPSFIGSGFTRRDGCTLACCVLPRAMMMGLFEAAGVTAPRGMRKLKDLHTLRFVYVGMGNAVLQDIKKLTGLRKLGVVGINKKNAGAFRSVVSNLSRLESLSVRSAGNNTGLLDCLDSISSPPENLRSLKLYGNLKKLPEWIKELPHLVKLKLVDTKLSEHDAAMEFLGKLLKLEILVLSGLWSLFEGEELYFKCLQTGTAFRRLRVLSLGVSNVKSVKFEEGTMLKLERLLVTGKVNNELVNFSGLESLPSISEVQLRVSFPWDEEEERRKNGELKKKIQEQLAGNTNEPIVTVD
ncbi:unnamed protein product [Urochloa decumbens]|uniref:Disease resistance protein RPM1 n=1 Tax=Urochloa decumbens TaxID=240449 RepID=A0ABC9AR15_9POAL